MTLIIIYVQYNMQTYVTVTSSNETFQNYHLGFPNSSSRPPLTIPSPRRGEFTYHPTNQQLDSRKELRDAYAMQKDKTR